jgi:hypothetical protein
MGAKKKATIFLPLFVVANNHSMFEPHIKEIHLKTAGKGYLK